MHVVLFGQFGVIVAVEGRVNLSVALAELPVVVLGDVDQLATPVICQTIRHIAGNEVGRFWRNVMAKMRARPVHEVRQELIPAACHVGVSVDESGHEVGI